MPVKEIARELQGKAANLALRMPIAWVNILAGPPVAVDGRTLDGRTQWLLQLLARSGQTPIEKTSVAEARAGYDAFMLEMGGRPAPIGEIVDRTIEGPAGRLRVRTYRPAGTVAPPGFAGATTAGFSTDSWPESASAVTRGEGACAT